jgi:hypothetical protein
MNRILNPEIAWAAGFYEGEGSVSACGGHKLILSVSQAGDEPLRKFKSAIGLGAISGPYMGKSRFQRQPIYRFQANGENVLACLQMMWPMLSKRRQEQALRALCRWMFRSVSNRVGVRRPSASSSKPTAWSERLHGIREYVPPELRTAHEAVAWTFGLSGEEYHPALES